MTKKSIKLQANLIPLFVLFGALILIYFVFLSDQEIIRFSKSPEVRRLNGFPTTVYTDKDMEKKRLVITSEEELNNFLNEVDESGYVIVREEINFDKETILAVSTDANAVEGYKIKIRKLYEDKDSNKLLVSLRETIPGASCEKIENKNVAVDMVAISNTLRTIEFERVKEVKECD